MSEGSTPDKPFLEFPLDIYRVNKEHLQLILRKYKIKYNESDNVSTLRPIVADLKAFFKHPLTEQRKYTLRKLLSRKYLSDVELQKYPQLQRIQEFLQERENLYDSPASDPEPDYEEIRSRGVSPISAHLETEPAEHEHALQGNLTHKLNNTSPNLSLTSPKPESHSIGNDLKSIFRAIDSINQPQRRDMATAVKEKLPLISAGTYHGLSTENPIDFIERYEIAAQSNHWQEESKLNLFPAHLTGTTLAWYQHFTKSNNIYLENVKGNFH